MDVKHKRLLAFRQDSNIRVFGPKIKMLINPSVK